MAKPDYKQFNVSNHPNMEIEDIKIGIVHTEWNVDIIEILTSSCKKTLLESGIKEDNICIECVPGSYELPVGAKFLLSSKFEPNAVICLGCVIKGETSHDEVINHAIAQSISHLSIASSKPVIFGVLTTNNKEQAVARADGSRGDKGTESAMAALKMLALQSKLQNKGKKISF